MRTYFICLLMAVASLSAWGQGKMYTKKVLLGDFTAKTTKVVITGSSMVESALKAEIASRWRISPYEFCTQQDYEALHSDNSYYFLRMVQEEGIVFLKLSKGGREGDTDTMKRPFDIVSLPVASAGNPTGHELVFMGALIDIIQTFVEEASYSDRTAYGGLELANTKKLTGKRVYVNTDDVDELYMEGRANTLLGITIAPVNISTRSVCFKMLVAADTHELYYFNRSRYRGEADASFTEAEIKSFDRRNGIIPR